MPIAFPTGQWTLYIGRKGSSPSDQGLLTLNEFGGIRSGSIALALANDRDFAIANITFSTATGAISFDSPSATEYFQGSYPYNFRFTGTYTPATNGFSVGAAWVPQEYYDQLPGDDEGGTVGSDPDNATWVGSGG